MFLNARPSAPMFYMGPIKSDLRKSSTTKRSSLPSTASQQSENEPAMTRYLLDGNPTPAQKQGERTGYAPGAQGMKRFLKEWEERWKDMSGNVEVDKK